MATVPTIPAQPDNTPNRRAVLVEELAAIDSLPARLSQIDALKIERDQVIDELATARAGKPTRTAATGPLSVYGHATDSERSFINRIEQEMITAVQGGGIRPELITELCAQLVPRLAAGLVDREANYSYNTEVNTLQARISGLNERITKLEYPNGRPSLPPMPMPTPKGETHNGHLPNRTAKAASP